MERLKRLVNENKIIIIGITGGIGSGKSKIADYLTDKHDVTVYKADQIGHKVMEKGTECYEKIVLAFGNEVLSEDDNIDRNRISALIFNDESKLKLMNSIIHPAVEEYIILQILEEYNKYGQRFFAIEAALLIEAGYKKICTHLWYVHADENIRIARLMNSRGYTYDKCINIIKSQLSMEEFMKNCNCIIDNGNDFDNTKNQIEKHMNFCYNNTID